MDYRFIFTFCFLTITLCKNFYRLTRGTWWMTWYEFSSKTFWDFLLILGHILEQSLRPPVYFHPRKRHQLHKRRVFQKKPALLVVNSVRPPHHLHRQNVMFTFRFLVASLALFACFLTPFKAFSLLWFTFLQNRLFVFLDFGIIYLVLNAMKYCKKW